MRQTTLHRVDGVGKQISPDETRPFDPRAFEQAIHALQKMILDAVRIDDDRYADDYNPSHEHAVEDDEKVIRVQEDTTLHSVCRLLMPKWDTSVLVDLLHDNSYGVRTSVDCGGEVLVYATFFVQDGMLRRFDVGHNYISDPDEQMEVKSLSVNTSSREITHLNRTLERAVTEGYAATISNAAPAFDYIATRSDIPPSGPRPAPSKKLRERHSQKEWANVREKTQQTVSDNVRDAQERLHDLPDSPTFNSRGPALEELDPDDDDPGDLRLV